MADGRVKRAVQQGKARSTEIKTRMPELRERVPELTGELRTRGSELARQYAEMDVSWARCGYAKAAREALLSLGLGPLIDFYVRNRTVGRGVFDTLKHPVIFVANHSSHLDTPTILRAMPRKWRSRTAVAAAADYFYDSRWKARGVALLFNTVPIGRKGGGLGEGATDHVDRLIDDGWNLVMFPEGTRSRDGKVGRVRSGAAVIAANHDIDVVPIYVSGTHEAMPPGQNWPRRIPRHPFSRRHEVEVRFGRPIRPRDVDHRHEVMDEVRAFWERKGLPAPASTDSPPAAPAPPAHAPRRFERPAATPPARHRDRSTTTA
jgi:1-acyl-sn-glycerol-3-phosphate acyltransferase